jgi:hypothetical protein
MTPRTSRRKESSGGGPNHRGFAVPFCSKLAGIGDDGVKPGCDSLRRLPRKPPGELVHLLEPFFVLRIIRSLMSQ